MGQNRTPTAKAPKYVLSNFSFIVFGASSDRKLLSDCIPTGTSGTP